VVKRRKRAKQAAHLEIWKGKQLQEIPDNIVRGSVRGIRGFRQANQKGAVLLTCIRYTRLHWSRADARLGKEEEDGCHEST